MPERYLSASEAPAVAPAGHSWSVCVAINDGVSRAAHIMGDAFSTAPVLHSLCGSRFKARLPIDRMPLAYFCPQCARAASEGC